MSFPLNPANNQVTLENGISYTYNASRSAWYRTPITTQSSITSNTFTVLNSIIFADGTSQTSAASPTDSYARDTANTATSNITVLQGVDAAQNTRMSIIEGTNTTQNTNITAADAKAQAAFDSANVIVGVNTTQNTNITAADVKAQAAFSKANTTPTTTASATAPSSPSAGDFWYDTSTDIMFRYVNDGTTSYWIDVSGPLTTDYIRQTYSIVANNYTLNESGSNTSVLLTITSTNVADNTTLYWTTSGSVVPADFADSANSGSFTITNNQGSFSKTISADLATEGSETFVIQLRTGSTSGPIIAFSPTITINDTSQDPYYAMYSMGYNANGGLGLNDTVSRSSPTQVGSLSNWASISTTGTQSSGAVSGAVKIDGTLWLWGLNSYGQLGQGDTIKRSSPTQVGALTNWSKVGVGGNNCFALKTDGTLWSWGYNSQGQLGHDNRTNYSSPRQIGTDNNWSKIYNAYGSLFGAIKTDGTLWLWGGNSYGQLGQGDTTSRSSPTQVGSGTTWSKLPENSYGSYAHMAAIQTDGTLWTCGYNGANQLGANRPTSRSTFGKVGTDTNWSQVSVSGNATLGVKTDGTLWACGDNSRNQLTSGGGSYSNMQNTSTGTTWSKVGLGDYWALGVKTDGTLWAWGKNTNGQIGLIPGYPYQGSPTQIGTNTNWNNISVGSTVLLTTNSA